jgi:hypothetical protein
MVQWQRWRLWSTRSGPKLFSALTEHPGFDSRQGQTISSPSRPDRISDSPGKWIDQHETYLPISQTKNYARVRVISAPSARRHGMMHTPSKHIWVLNPNNNRKFGLPSHKKNRPPVCKDKMCGEITLAYSKNHTKNINTSGVHSSVLRNIFL